MRLSSIGEVGRILPIKTEHAVYLLSCLLLFRLHESRCPRAATEQRGMLTANFDALTNPNYTPLTCQVRSNRSIDHIDASADHLVTASPQCTAGHDGTECDDPNRIKLIITTIRQKQAADWPILRIRQDSDRIGKGQTRNPPLTARERRKSKQQSVVD